MDFESQCLSEKRGRALGTKFNQLANDVISHAYEMAPEILKPIMVAPVYNPRGQEGEADVGGL